MRASSLSASGLSSNDERKEEINDDADDELFNEDDDRVFREEVDRGEARLAAADAERLALDLESDNHGIESLDKIVAKDSAFMRRTKKQVRHDKRQQALDCILDNEAHPIIESDEQVEREAKEAARQVRTEKSGKPSDQSVEVSFEQLRDRHVQRLANASSDDMLEDAAREEGDGIPVASLGITPSLDNHTTSDKEDEEEEDEDEDEEKNGADDAELPMRAPALTKTDASGWTPLHHAAMCEQSSLVTVLVQSGYQVNARTSVATIMTVPTITKSGKVQRVVPIPAGCNVAHIAVLCWRLESFRVILDFASVYLLLAKNESGLNVYQLINEPQHRAFKGKPSIREEFRVALQHHIQSMGLESLFGGESADMTAMPKKRVRSPSDTAKQSSLEKEVGNEDLLHLSLQEIISDDNPKPQAAAAAPPAPLQITVMSSDQQPSKKARMTPGPSGSAVDRTPSSSSPAWHSMSMAEFLTSLGLDRYRSCFEAEDIKPYQLGWLTEAELAKMLPTLGARLTLRQFLCEQRLKL